MNDNITGPIGELDYIRRARGIDACKNTFRRLAAKRRERAVRLINDRALQFPTLYVLIPELIEFNLTSELNGRNQTALAICSKIINGKNAGSEINGSPALNSEASHQALLWIFETGVRDDGLSDEYDQILDISASLLIKTHHEKRILPLAADLIFRRNQNEGYLHDLTWAYFQSREPDALRYIARRLRSSAKKDMELARTLLHLPQKEAQSIRENQKEYDGYLSWLEENRSYLNFTGESFQLTNHPVPCKVDVDLKYLGRQNPYHSSKKRPTLTEEELARLQRFKEAQEEEREMLARYSHRLHRRNPTYWNQWKALPVSKQIEIAKTGRRDFL